MNYIEEIIGFIPSNDQENQDKRAILNYIGQSPHNILFRENEIAHITSSAFIMNRALDRVLMVHHNIRKKWSWTGGHADGDTDLLHVAVKEAKEETGLDDVAPLMKSIASIDILPVYGHVRNGRYVNAHLHLSIAYILIADEKQKVKVNKDENSGVRWFDLDIFNEDCFDIYDVYLYSKLIVKARQAAGDINTSPRFAGV